MGIVRFNRKCFWDALTSAVRQRFLFILRHSIIGWLRLFLSKLLRSSEIDETGTASFHVSIYRGPGKAPSSDEYNSDNNNQKNTNTDNTFDADDWSDTDASFIDMWWRADLNGIILLANFIRRLQIVNFCGIIDSKASNSKCNIVETIAQVNWLISFISLIHIAQVEIFHRYEFFKQRIIFPVSENPSKWMDLKVFQVIRRNV